MRSANESQLLVLVALGLVATLIVSLCACESPTPTSTSDIFPPYVEGILSFTDGAPFLFTEEGDLCNEFGERLENDPANLKLCVLTAQACQTSGQYRKAILYLEMASIFDSELADPHYGLGNLFYDLALLDLVARQQYTHHELGPLLFDPDETTRQLFRHALDEYNLGKTLPKSLDFRDKDGNLVVFYDPSKVDNRIRQSSLYLGGAPEEAIFTEDQAKASMWMMALDEHFPEYGYMESARRVLDFFANKWEESEAQSLYDRFSQGVESGGDTFGKRVFLQIDQSSHPNRIYMGDSLFLQTFINVWRTACESHWRVASGDTEDLAIKSFSLVTDIMGGMSITLPETLTEALGEDACREVALIEAVEQEAYEQLLAERDQATADIFQISGYVVLLDEFFSLPADVQSDWGQFIGQMTARLGVMEAELDLPEDLNEGLLMQREELNQAINDASLQQDERFRAECADWLQDVLDYVLTDLDRMR